jgi:hypothetical protein
MPNISSTSKSRADKKLAGFRGLVKLNYVAEVTLVVVMTMWCFRNLFRHKGQIIMQR